MFIWASEGYAAYRADYMSWRYARFLDFAAKRIFLRKVGGGYIFVHRLLMEYFASLWTEEAERCSTERSLGITILAR